MARKLGKRDNRYLAKLVTEKRSPCAFCLREVDDEITFGKLYAIGDIQCHYFCCLLSCCLIQKGPDDEGLFGFMYTDILAEIERCKKHKCSYCSRIGANMGCCVGVCRKQFHLPCGREKNAISLYYGTYKSFCQQHAPKQKIPEHIMAKARLRRKVNQIKVKTVKETDSNMAGIATVALEQDSDKATEEMVCVICYEAVNGFPTIQTFWPPCCARDAWFHRSCVQRMALSAGMHYLKCPLCNDKEHFYEAVVNQGYYVPDRDAAWELEQNAFAEIYERPASCSAGSCLCPMGREHDAENGKWDIKLCLLCGSAGAHVQCIADQSQPTRDKSLDQSPSTTEHDTLSDTSQKAGGEELSMGQSNVLSLQYVCRSCLPAAPEDLSAFSNSIEAIIQQEQAESVSNARRPVMSSRMSLRRTKGRLALLNAPSSSRSYNFTKTETESDSLNTQTSRLELNLKSPRKPLSDSVILRDGRDVDTKMMSPVKLLEQSFREKVVCTGVRDAVLDESVIETLRRKFRKPRPLCEKKKIVNDILDGLFDSLMKDASKQKEQVKDWCSSKKTYSAMEVSKVLDNESSQSLEALDNYQDKENDSNTFNTPTKHADPKAEDKSNFANKDTNNFVNRKETKIEETSANKFTGICRKLSEAIVDDYNEVIDVKLSERNVVVMPKEISINTRNSINDNKNASSTERDIEETPMNIFQEPCRITRNSLSKVVIKFDKNDINKKNDDTNPIVEEIKETQTKELIENFRHTRNSKSKTINDVNNSNEVNKPSNQIFFVSDGEKINKPTKLQSSPLKIVLKKKLSLNKSNQKSKNTEKSSEQSFPVENIQYTENMDNTATIFNKDLLKKTCQPPTVKQMTKFDGCILRNLLTEKDVHSQLLLELTRGHIKENESPIINLVDTSIINDTPKNLTESPRNFIEAKNVENPKSKTIDMQQNSSLEISENDQSISIDVIKINNGLTNSDAYKQLNITMPEKTKTCSFKFSSLDKEMLEEKNVGIDVENFKKEYLSEVDREFMCKLKHKHVGTSCDEPKLRTAIDAAVDAAVEKETDSNEVVLQRSSKKRMLSESGVRLLFYNNVKKRKMSESDLNLSYCDKKPENTNIINEMPVDSKDSKKVSDENKRLKKTKERRNKKKNKKVTNDKNIEVAIDSSERRRGKSIILKKKIKTQIHNNVKKRKMSESDLNLLYCDEKLENSNIINEMPVDSKDSKKVADENKRLKKTKERRNKMKNKKVTNDKDIEVTIDSSERRRGKRNILKKKIKTKFAIRNNNIHVKIKWKKKQLSLNIESKKKAKKEKRKNLSKFKQYVLKFSEGSSKEIMMKPEKEVCPIKRKYVRQEKNPDKLKQTSIQSFFMSKPTEK